MQKQVFATEYTDAYGREWLKFVMTEFHMLKNAVDMQDSGAYLLVAAPHGKAGWGALAQGPRAYSTTFVEGNVEALPADSPTAVTFKLRELSPATDSAGPLVAVDLGVRVGADGAPGAALITPEDYAETPVAGQALVVAPGATEFELAWPKVGRLHWPSSLSDAPSGSVGSPITVAQINIDAGVYNFDYRVIPQGECRFEATSSNIQVNLVAHLNAIDGPVIGICRGIGGVAKERLNFSPGPAAGSADTVGKVTAGNGAVVFINTERVDGSASYTALSDYMHFSGLVVSA